LQIDAPLSDAEVAFIGWYLTDGYLNRSNNTVTISQSSEKFDSEVRKVLNDCRFGFREYLQTRKGDLERYAHGIQFVIPFGASRSLSDSQRGWADLEAWLDKDIPEIFNSLSARQFSILLNAMNLANGRIPTVMDYLPKVMSISVGCRQRMADRIQQLAIERGFRCNVKRFLQNPSHWNQTPQPQWMLYIKRQCVAHVGGTRIDKNSLEARRCQLRPVEFDRNEWVWCLTTDRGTLVTRRNGKVSILGNCGRGFRLHPSKQNCLVLDFGGNVLRHGPVDDIRINTHDRGDGKAPAKQCPECNALIAIGFASCPQCGYEFPPPDRKPHDAKASEAGILSGQVTTTKYQVDDVYYAMHSKRDAEEGAPRTLRVDYRVGWQNFKSEWVCFEHEGYARQKAIAWWRKRSDDPVPDTVDRALEIIEGGGLAKTIEITVRSVAGEKFERIIDHTLGPIPETLGISDRSEVDLEEAPF
jgi:hypothetical protein